MTAQDIGNDIGLSVLSNEILFAGIVAMPERAGQTLEKYNMSFEKVKETAIAQVRKSVSDLVEGGNRERDALPFSAASKTPVNCSVPVTTNMRNIARVKPKSPTRLVMKAFLAARALPMPSFPFSNQKPISR